MDYYIGDGWHAEFYSALAYSHSIAKLVNKKRGQPGSPYRDSTAVERNARGGEEEGGEEGKEEEDEEEVCWLRVLQSV